jgi:aerobic-type carbon monoxide dehydrogenase small subunit (CoxS/CutS family)
MSEHLTRRAFLKSSAATTAGTAFGQTAAADATPPAGTGDLPMGASGPEPVPVDLIVNGTRRTINLEPRTTLAEVLRGPLALTGTKVACDRGACSACTVWLDGQPALACMTLAVEAAGRSVTTIEGLARGGTLHPVQQAFIEHDALQCGFCTSGMVMSCAALLVRWPNPAPDDVQAAIAGHLCRCGSYPHVVDATLAAAGTGSPKG